MHKIALLDQPFPLDSSMWDAPTMLGDTSARDYQAFFTTTDGRKGSFFAFMNIDQNDEIEINIEFYINGAAGITGKGDAFRIFATVTKLTLIAYDQVRAWHKDSYITMLFTAKEMSRSKVYERLARGVAHMRDGTMLKDMPQHFAIRFDPVPSYA